MMLIDNLQSDLPASHMVFSLMAMNLDITVKPVQIEGVFLTKSWHTIPLCITEKYIPNI